jgi:superfamily II DNA or RNA helicase
MGIDDLADRRTTNTKSVDEKFEDQYLKQIPREQWPSYISETSLHVFDDITIPDKSDEDLLSDNLLLTGDSVGEKLGHQYKTGIETLANDSFDSCDGEDIGYLMQEMNRIIYKRSRSKNSVDEITPNEVLSSAVQKTVSKEADVSAGEYKSVSEAVISLLTNKKARKYSTKLADKLSEQNRSLISVVDEPQFTTELWEHQREALISWIDNDLTGFVDMATATGKTVLGLAAIGYKYGGLLPSDEREIDNKNRSIDSSDSDVLIVAHNRMILEQWRRQFEEHMAIPKVRTKPENNSISLSWGKIDFETPNNMSKIGSKSYDLVVLDEVHHYAARNSGWGEMLDNIEETDVIALSGSIDTKEHDTMEQRLNNTIGNKLLEYTLTDAQNDGIIPQLDWSVVYDEASPDSLNNFAELTETCKSLYPEYRKKLRSQYIETDKSKDLSSRYHFKTYDDMISFSYTNEAQNISNEEEDFKKLSTSLRSRRAHLWNTSPTTSTIVDLVEDHINDNVLVLLNSYKEVKQVNQQLEPLDIELFTVDGDGEQRNDTVEEFDSMDEPAVLTGVGDLLGEGVDIKSVSVCINVARGNVSNMLLQRVGRVLRNDENKELATFYNLVALPTGKSNIVPKQDGKRLIERTAEYYNLGGRVNCNPSISITKGAEKTVAAMETRGSELVSELLNQGEYNPQENVEDIIQEIVENKSIIQVMQQKEESEQQEIQQYADDIEENENSSPEDKESERLEYRVKSLEADVRFLKSKVHELQKELDNGQPSENEKEQEERSSLLSTISKLVNHDK